MVVPGERPKNVSIQDYMQQLVYNAMLPYLDPITRGTTREWLARANPTAFASYGGTGFGYSGGPGEKIAFPTGTGGIPTGPPAEWDLPVFTTPDGDTAQQQLPDPNPPTGPTSGGTWGDWYTQIYPGFNNVGSWVNPYNLTQIWDQLARGRLREGMPESVRSDLLGGTSQAEAGWGEAQKKALSEANIAAGQDAYAGLNWLREAINTARGATTAGGATRAQQRLAGEHLATLFREAEQEPGRAGRYTTLMQNMVNPVLRRAPESGLFGFARAATGPPGDFRRKGLSYRNVGFT
jgi:hypothetical protein